MFSIFCVFFAPISSVKASTLAIDTVGGQIGDPLGQNTRGNYFSLSDSVLINGLGYFDTNGDGLSDSHDVGIFTSVGTLISPVVAITSDDTLVSSGSALGDWRVEWITPFLLGPGDYLIVGFDPNGIDGLPIYDTYSDISQVARINRSSQHSSGSGLMFPATTEDYNVSAVTFTTAAIPEPATMLLFGIGLLGFAGVNRRKQ